MRRPAIALRRILTYDGKMVSFQYFDKTEKKEKIETIETITVMEFIANKCLIHISDGTPFNNLI